MTPLSVRKVEAPMTNRERIRAILHGRELDRVPFLQYTGLAGPDEEIWREIGRDRLGIIRWSAVHRLQTPNCRHETTQTVRDGRHVSVTTLTTPAGSLVQEQHRDPESGAYFPVRRLVNREADYAVLAAYIRDIEVVEDFDRFRSDERELGDDGLAMAKLEKTPYQQLWVPCAALENLCVHLADCAGAVEACMSLWADVCRRVQCVVEKAVETLGVEYVNYPDNITAPVIGRAYFDRYCVPLYREAAAMLGSHGLPLIAHLDGELGPLRESIARSNVGGIDSFTPEPDTTNRVNAALGWWPGMRLFVNFPSSVHLLGPDAVYETAVALLDQGGQSGRMALQISEDIPPGVWRTSFPAIVRAITLHGVPVLP
jgi:hypothetical protein